MHHDQATLAELLPRIVPSPADPAILPIASAVEKLERGPLAFVFDDGEPIVVVPDMIRPVLSRFGWSASHLSEFFKCSRSRAERMRYSKVRLTPEETKLFLNLPAANLHEDLAVINDFQKGWYPTSIPEWSDTFDPRLMRLVCLIMARQDQTVDSAIAAVSMLRQESVKDLLYWSQNA